MRSKTRLVSLALVASLTALWPSGAGAAPAERNSYIVVLKGSVDRPASIAQNQAGRFGTDLDYVYRHAIEGFALDLTSAQAGVLAGNPNVVSIERDARVSVQTTQTGATWGLDRIDQRNLPLDGSFTYNNTSAGVTAYIIDTGILFGHNEFGGRAVSGFDSVDGGSADDCNGHGTHVAGTVGGSTFGVAKSASLVAVRVLNCAGSGTTSGVIAGIDWVTADHQAGAPAVANMSLGGGASTALDNAVRNSIADGVSYAVAAGNGDILGFEDDACFYSPARVAEAMTISATDSSDQKASWANYGSCVDWFAPGVSITSAWYTGTTATNTISGTSMATPHTAGVAALYLQGNPGASPATVRQAIFDLTTKNIVGGSSTPNAHLLFTNL